MGGKRLCYNNKKSWMNLISHFGKSIGSAKGPYRIDCLYQDNLKSWMGTRSHSRRSNDNTLSNTETSPEYPKHFAEGWGGRGRGSTDLTYALRKVDVSPEITGWKSTKSAKPLWKIAQSCYNIFLGRPSSPCHIESRSGRSTKFTKSG